MGKPEILEDGFKFSEGGLYNSIPVGEKEDYLEYIRALPLNPKPEAFGLHENAEITTSQLEVINLTEGMLSMQPRTSSGKGKTREEVIMDLAKFLESKTRPVFDLEIVGKKFPTDYNESMNTVVCQECVRYNGLLAAMKVSLAAVQRALVGEIVMTEDLEEISRKNKIPIDRVAYNYDVRDDITHESIKEKPDDGVFVFGLFLEGCKWDFNTHVLADSDPKKLF